MPRGHILVPQDLEADILLHNLTQEWANPDPNALEPVIIESAEERYFGSTHLYVIWSDWASRSQQERSIRTNYQSVQGNP